MVGDAGGADGPLGAAALDALGVAFTAGYRERYGTAPGGPVEVVAVVVRVGEPEVPRPATGAATHAGPTPAGPARRRAHFAESGGFTEVDVWARRDCRPGAAITGPAIVEEAGSTVVVPPGWVAAADGGGRLILTRQGLVADSPRPTSSVEPVTKPSSVAR